MKRKQILIAAGALLIACSGCRTTVNNYQEAYDIAQMKRSETLVDVVDPSVRVQRDDDARLQAVAGDSVPVRTAVCSYVDGPQNRFAVVTARYKMNTNALAHYRRLAAADKSAMLVQDTEEQYLVAPFSFTSLADAAREYRRLVSGKDTPSTPGLPSGPYILHIP